MSSVKDYQLVSGYRVSLLKHRTR